MSEVIYKLDPDGDIFLVLPKVPESLPESPLDIDGSTLAGLSGSRIHSESAPESPNIIEAPREDNGIIDTLQDPPDAEGPLLQIRVSSKHLTLSCPQVARTLQSTFREGNELRSQGHVTINVDWPALPTLILMMIIHRRTRAVPRALSLERLTDMARLVNYYECYEVVAVFSEMWINALDEKSPVPSLRDEERQLFISWVFQNNTMFAKSSKYSLLHHKKAMQTDLPIPRRIQGQYPMSPTPPVSGPLLRN
ncbi:hypothetical protein BDV26DRAFT_302087 [Aspergillus bertholletiae]|uniref:BTB domain-containing protein n=1 Tax=Aspergillus bertholletiae TaxID=1226010 RepID=A0A5N7ARB3_9EURO|nr:hypothetical protein BDV26DRAFT_302087 [Aspergillus bertholletiae]